MVGVEVEPALVEALRANSWPGNVRELENTVARLLALAPDERLTLALWRSLSEGPLASVGADDGARAIRARDIRSAGGSRRSSARSSPRSSRRRGATRARPRGASASRDRRSSRSCTSTGSSVDDPARRRSRAATALATLAACSREHASPRAGDATRGASCRCRPRPPRRSSPSAPAIGSWGARATATGRPRRAGCRRSAASSIRTSKRSSRSNRTSSSAARARRRRKLAERLEALGIATWFPAIESFDGDRRDDPRPRRAHGPRGARRATSWRTSTRAALAVERVRRGRARAARAHGARRRARRRAGPKDFADEMIRRAGGDNVVATGGPVADPRLRARSSTSIPTSSSTRHVANGGGASTDHGATRRAGRTCAPCARVASSRSPDERVLRPGPRVAEGLAVLARALHPTRPCQAERSCPRPRLDQSPRSRAGSRRRGRGRRRSCSPARSSSRASASTRPARSCPTTRRSTCAAPTTPYVSRGGVKLAGALDAFALDVTRPAVPRRRRVDRRLHRLPPAARRGAGRRRRRRLRAARAQAPRRPARRRAWSARTRARSRREAIGGAVDLTVVDASFIGLGKLMPAIARCTREGGVLVALVKPQFEVGRDEASRGARRRPRRGRARRARSRARRRPSRRRASRSSAECDSAAPRPEGQPSRRSCTRAGSANGMPRRGYSARARMKSAPRLGAIFLTVFLDLLGFGLVLPFLAKEARDAFGVSTFVATLLGSVYSLMQFLFVPVWGRVSDRVGRRPVLIWSIAGTVLVDGAASASASRGAAASSGSSRRASSAASRRRTSAPPARTSRTSRSPRSARGAWASSARPSGSGSSSAPGSAVRSRRSRSTDDTGRCRASSRRRSASSTSCGSSSDSPSRSRPRDAPPRRAGGSRRSTSRPHGTPSRSPGWRWRSWSTSSSS